MSARVVAPVPWFPAKNPKFGKYAKFAAVPMSEVRNQIEVFHPRYPVLPKIGMSFAPLLLALAVYRDIKKFSEDSTGFDLIDAHYFYPDGVAATLLGQWLGKAVIITARGTDVNLIPKYLLPRKWILWAAKRCAKIITVSDALRKELQHLGVPAEKIRTIRNGVDLDAFRPLLNRGELRKNLSFDGPVLLSVGHLIERKGHHLVIEALDSLPHCTLIVVGVGPMQNRLMTLAQKRNVSDRVRFDGVVTHDELVKYYNAADALVLASSREGMANVLLESIACGTPVVATPYWGNPEVVADRRTGVLMAGRTATDLATAVQSLLRDPPERSTVRKYAEAFSWDDTTRGQLEVFHDVLHRG